MMTALAGTHWLASAWRKAPPASTLQGTQGFWTGIGLALTACLSAILYAASTWDEPNRATLVTIFAVSLVACTAAAAIPSIRRAWTEQRNRMSIIAALLALWVTTVGASLDGGAASQLTLLYFLPVVFGALVFPLRSVLAVGAAALLSYVVLGLGTGPAAIGDLSFFGAMLGCLALACALHAQEVDRQRKRLTELSRTDPLTGALNRRGFRERALAELERARREAKPLSMCILDLDSFKEVNDTLGHQAGDELLAWTSETLGEVVRGMDTVGRLGGDEFAVVLPDADNETARRIAARAREALAVRVSASAGIASFPEDGADLAELEAHADEDLGRQKAGMDTPGRRELAWARGLADSAEIRMGGAGDHGEVVAMHAVAVAKRLGWLGPDVARLRVAALLHDVGKLGIAEAILRKPDSLSVAEYAQVQTHAALGAELIGRVEGMEVIATWIRHSHERVDGSGYPDGLRGDAIPLASRIIHVADAFDAITSDRPYRQARSVEEALDELRRCSGTQFDPTCVETFVAHVESHATAAVAAA